MMICPAIVPTAEDERPEASSATPKRRDAALTQQRRQRLVARLQRADLVWPLP